MSLPFRDVAGGFRDAVPIRQFLNGVVGFFEAIAVAIAGVVEIAEDRGGVGQLHDAAYALVGNFSQEPVAFFVEKLNQRFFFHGYSV